MSGIADFFSVVAAVGAVVIIPAAYQPIYQSSKTKNYESLVKVDWGNEGDISTSYPHFIHIQLEKAEGDWTFSGELTCTINPEEKFVIQGKLRCLRTIDAVIHRTIGWRAIEIGKAKIKYDRRTNQCRFIPQKVAQKKLETDCERAIFSTSLPLWGNDKSPV
ncbi:TPA: hypothetical protein KNH22_001635 [Escherichia coli]|uniref:Uncharacterized protein n=3 Tax=Escherichia coli TaxID=562 RepID=A0A376FML5_ECOLX|nr:hypothetical protein [Escherichia coli]EEZ6067151.1 hypothetical protein [Escherichia coli O121]HAT7999703.1 hypothetical protein [Citrobacter braakii]ASZ40728.1 hypothetical protein CLD27_04520 [Escherichia coli]EAC1522044.1 hypothetical protein [Escherichia coli]EEQ2896474.1 hypothetical protein [Escherichia coli]